MYKNDKAMLKESVKELDDKAKTTSGMATIMGGTGLAALTWSGKMMYERSKAKEELGVTAEQTPRTKQLEETVQEADACILGLSVLGAFNLLAAGGLYLFVRQYRKDRQAGYLGPV
jgi:hypothetical protein